MEQPRRRARTSQQCGSGKAREIRSELASFAAFCITASLDALRFVVLLALIAAVEVVVRLSVPSATWASAFVEFTHHVLVIGAAAVIPYRRLLSGSLRTHIEKWFHITAGSRAR
jgi:hypothetical protein